MDSTALSVLAAVVVGALGHVLREHRFDVRSDALDERYIRHLEADAAH